jgi:hypothetical protein
MPPPIHIISHTNPVHILRCSSSKIHCGILPFALSFSMSVLFLPIFLPNIHVNFTSLSRVERAASMSHSLLSASQHHVPTCASANYEVSLLLGTWIRGRMVSLLRRVISKYSTKTNSVVISQLANWTDRATAAADEFNADFSGQRVLRGQCNGSLRPLISVCRPKAQLLLPSSSSLILTRLRGSRSRSTTSKTICWSWELNLGRLDL